MDQNTIQIQKGRASLNMWSAHCQGHRQGQHKRPTPSPRIEIKISDSGGNRPQRLRVGRQGLYRPRHSDGQVQTSEAINSSQISINTFYI